MKGQAAFEYLVMFSVVLAILTILTYYAQNMTESNSQDIISSNAIIAVNKIAEAANIVYTQGEPSQITISVYIPQNVNSIIFFKNVIDMKIQVGSGISDTFATSKANFTVADSFISNGFGTKKIKVKCCEGNNVSVTES